MYRLGFPTHHRSQQPNAVAVQKSWHMEVKHGEYAEVLSASLCVNLQ